jgi:hypothetical protein
LIVFRKSTIREVDVVFCSYRHSGFVFGIDEIGCLVGNLPHRRIAVAGGDAEFADRTSPIMSTSNGTRIATNDERAGGAPVS